MPIYEYACTSCGHQFEKLQRMGASAPVCPSCGSYGAERQVSLSSFQLKGSGWYSSDYKSSAKPSSGSDAGSDSGSDSSGGSSSGGAAAAGGGCGTGCGCH